jgi:hypothetical protein
MSTPHLSPRNRAERRLASKGKRARAAGAALTAGSAALAMGAAWIGPGLPAASAASTLHVTNTDDAGAGSLRDTVAGASAGDTIVFDVTGTITLTTGEIAFNQGLTISGPGAAALTISGNDASRVFDISGGAAVTISGLTLAHGSSGSSGGAVSSDGPVTLDADVFDQNVSGDDGGAVEAPSATITNSTFTGNETDDWGGAILVDGGDATTVSGSSFSGNTAGNTGGALAIADVSSGSVTSSTFSGNHASRAGALVSWATDSTTITGSTFTENQANGGGGQEPGTGGAIALYSTGSASIGGTTISGNTASSGGGGVHALYLADLAIADSTISGNQSNAWGGGLYIGEFQAPLSITNSTISGNTAASGGGGGQIWGDDTDAAVSVIDTTISGNTAEGSGGGGLIQWGVAGPTTVANSTISGNTSSGDGGGLYFYNSTVNVEMSTVTGNTSTESSTGGIYLAGAGELQAAGSGGHHAAAEVRSGGAGPDHDGARAQGAGDVRASAAVSATVTGTIAWGNSGDDLGGEGNVTLSHVLRNTLSAGLAVTDAGGNLTGVDPLLGPLQNNGGATATHALLAGSPAKDAGADPVPDFAGNEFDQRGAGFARVVDGRSDIGAFEVQPPEGPAAEPVVITPKFTG